MQHYTQALKMSPSLLILDNIHALCPLISNDEQFNIVESLKTLKITSLLVKLLEREEVSFLGVTRHFMSLNTKLLDVGLFDTMVEMQPPSKEIRYALIRDVIAPESMRTKEIQLQKLA